MHYGNGFVIFEECLTVEVHLWTERLSLLVHREIDRFATYIEYCMVPADSFLEQNMPITWELLKIVQQDHQSYNVLKMMSDAAGTLIPPPKAVL